MSPTRTLSPRQGNMLLWAGLLSPASLYFPALVLPEAGAEIGRAHV